jgi:putative MATE family efflux protein
MDERLKPEARDRYILRLGLPALLTALIVPLYTLADTAIVGRRLGTTALGGLAVASGVLNVAFLVFNFLQFATTSRVAFLTGQESHAEAASYAAQGLWVSAVVGIPIGLVLALDGGWFASLIGGKGQVHAAAVTYLHIDGAAMPFVLVTLVGNAYFRGLSDMRTPLRIMVASNVLNVVLEVIFVYVLHLGIAGSAWGTLIAQALTAGWFLALLADRFAKSGAGLRPQRDHLFEQIRVARFLIVRTAALIAAPTIATSVAAHLGTTSLDCQQILYQVWTFLAVLFSGLSVPSQSITGTLLGRNQRAEAREYARRLLWLGTWLGVAIGAVVAALSDVIPRIFTTNGVVIGRTAPVLILMAVLQIPNASLWVLDGILMGASEYRFMLYSTMGGLVLFLPMALAVLHWHHLGIIGLWCAMGIWATGRLTTNVLRYRALPWARERSIHGGIDLDAAQGA